LKARRGSKKAIIATSRKLLVVIYNLLKNNEVFDEGKFELAKKKFDEARFKRIKFEAKKFGYDLVSIHTA